MEMIMKTMAFWSITTKARIPALKPRLASPARLIVISRASLASADDKHERRDRPFRKAMCQRLFGFGIDLDELEAGLEVARRGLPRGLARLSAAAARQARA